LARQLYSKKITHPNIGTYNKLTGGIILPLTSQPAVKPYYSIALIPYKLPQISNRCFTANFCSRAAIRAADQYWFFVVHILALLYYRIVLRFTYKSYSLQRSLLVKLEEGNINALPLLYF
jgi:hypothetical protein